MADVDLDQMEAVARAATQADWSYDRGLVPPDGPDWYSDVTIDGGETTIAQVNDRIPCGDSNGYFIARFDPPTVLSLISRARDLEAELERVKAERDELLSMCRAAVAKDELKRILAAKEPSHAD